MNETAIRWTELTWNPWSGCEKVSAGCRYCYAETLAEAKRGTLAFPNGFDLTMRKPAKFREPFGVKKPSLIFMNSMSDFFWDKVSDADRDRALDVVEQTPQHQYQMLTKRPEAMVRYFRRRKVPSNLWPGVSIESQATAGRLEFLKQVEAEIRWISAEPLLGPLVLDLTGIAWLVSGGESGLHLLDPAVREKRALVTYQGPKTPASAGPRWTPRPECVDWVRSLRDQCEFFGAAFLHKQWGGVRPESAGHILDGKDHSAYPRLPGPPSQAPAGMLL